MRRLLLFALLLPLAARAQERVLLEAEVRVETEAIRITVVRPSIDFGAVLPMSSVLLDPARHRHGLPAEIRVEGGPGTLVQAFVETPHVVLRNDQGDAIPLRVLTAAADCSGRGASAPMVGAAADYSCRRLLIGGQLRVGRVTPGHYRGHVAIVVSAM